MYLVINKDTQRAHLSAKMCNNQYMENLDFFYRDSDEVQSKKIIGV